MRFAAILLFAADCCRGEPVTYSKHIAPLIYQHCSACHRPGEAAPFSLLTYGDVKKRASQIVRVTASRYMPPWLPEPGHGDFAGSQRLTDEEIARIRNWVENGAPEGNPADLPAAPHFVEGWQLGKPDLVVRMRAPFQLPPSTGDVFRNFVLPVDLKETRFIRAIELRPDNKRVVHHANIIVDRSRQLRRRDGEDGQPGFPGMDVETEVTGAFDPDSHFLFWKPGSKAQEEPADLAWRLDPESDLIVNLHLQPSGKPEAIDVMAGLYFSKTPPTRFPMLLQLEHDGAIDIPPGDKSFSVTDHLKLPMAVSVLAIYPHAHYLGKQVEAWAELPGGGRKDLILIRNWDINWQATFTYKQPVELPAGTTVAMRITYDNSAANPRNPTHPPTRIHSGNRTVDEMGHVWLQVLPKQTGDLDPRLELQRALMLRRIEKYPADFVAHFNLGAALQAMGKPAEAQPYLEQAVRMRPANAAARNNLAVSYFEQENFPAAGREFRKALEIDPGYQSARYNLARTLVETGDAPAALTELTIYLRSDPGDAEAQEMAGRVCAALKRFAESIPYFQRAVLLKPSDAGFQANLGAALAASGQLAEAQSAFENALKADPTNAIIRQNLERVRRDIQARH